MTAPLQPPAGPHASAPPRVSIVIPTLNSARTLAACLDAIRAQRPPDGGYEIVIADAASSDATPAIAARYGVERFVANPLKTGEAGKAAAIAAARGELIALIDSDNILPDSDWLRRMLAPFDDPEIFGAEPLEYAWRPQDPPLTRYFAMLGMNDPLCLFIGNYDRVCAITGRWTALRVPQEDRGDYLKLTLDAAHLPTIGANGFIFRRALLERVAWQPYFFDIDVVQQAVASGWRSVAKVRVGIAHLYCDKLGLFARKQRRRIRDFLYFNQARQRTYPWRTGSRLAVARFALCTLLVAPLLFQMARGLARRRDAAWWYHLPVCWITLWVYGAAVMARALWRRPAMLDRQDWQQGGKAHG